MFTTSVSGSPKCPACGDNPNVRWCINPECSKFRWSAAKSGHVVLVADPDDTLPLGGGTTEMSEAPA